MKNYIVIVFVMLINTVLSQNKVVSGYVTDSKSDEILIGANVYDIDTQTGTSTNKFGFYKLNLNDKTKHQIQISCVGYKTKLIELKATNDTFQLIKLDLSAHNLNDLVVISKKKIEQRAEMGKLEMPIATLQTLPSLMAEADILKAFQLMPGVQMGAENTNGLFVRGGSADQNLFLLDDVALYNVNHLGGFFSVFDPSMLKSVDLYKGGFPSRYGGRISSVMDIRTKDGNLHQHKGEFALSILSSKLFLEGPIKSAKASYALSIRYCNFGLYSWLMANQTADNGIGMYYFYDINLKTSYILSSKNRLFVNFYKGNDIITYNEKNPIANNSNLLYKENSDTKWGNTSGSIRWLYSTNNGFFNNTTLSFSSYNYSNELKSSTTNTKTKEKTIDFFKTNSAINDLTLKNDAEYTLHTHTFRFGLSATTHFNTPGSVSQSNSEIELSNQNSNKTKSTNSIDLLGYSEWEHKLGSKLTSNIGIRTGIFAVKNKTYPFLEPRIVLNYLVLPSYSIKVSFTKMHQNMHLLTNSNGGLPTDSWIPSTSTIKPEVANQLSIGLAHTTQNNYEMSIELYTKKMHNLIDYKDGISIFNGNQNWENKIELDGEGSAKGIELLVQKKSGKFTGWVAYTLSSNKRRFEQLNNGEEYPYIYDQTHNINLTANYKLTKNTTVSAIWTYHTGNRITLPVANYQIANNDHLGNLILTDVEIYSKKNGYQLPSYHRLDISINRSKALKKGIRNWSINIFNAYNRQNAYAVFYKKNSSNELKLYQRSFFPIILNFGYSYKW